MEASRSWAGLICLWLAPSCAYETSESERVATHAAALELGFAATPAPSRDGPGSFTGRRTTSPAPGRACWEPCAIGPAHAGCNDWCSKAMAVFDPYCVETWWDELCVRGAVTVCSLDCGCTHRLATPGHAQSADFCDCAASVCRLDSYCCTTAWDEPCTEEATASCRSSDLY